MARKRAIEGTTSPGCWRSVSGKHPGAKIIHDLRSDLEHGGSGDGGGGRDAGMSNRARLSRSDAYGGCHLWWGRNVSAHHYFLSVILPTATAGHPVAAGAELVCLKGQSCWVNWVRDRWRRFRRKRGNQQQISGAGGGHCAGGKRTSRKRRSACGTARTAFSMSFRTGVSTCARQTPNRWCA